MITSISQCTELDLDVFQPSLKVSVVKTYCMFWVAFEHDSLAIGLFELLFFMGCFA